MKIIKGGKLVSYFSRLGQWAVKFMGRPAGAVTGLAVFLAAVNIASQIWYFRIDLSQGHIYSPSKASRKILRSLEDPIIVKGYFSKDLPQPYSTYRDYLKDLLRAFKNYGGKNFQFRFVSYSDDAKLQNEALSMGVAPVRLTFIAKDKYEVKDGLMGAVILYRDKKESIPVIRDVSGLEYDLTSRIKKLIAKEPRIIGILHGKGTGGIDFSLIEGLRQSYEIKEIDITQTPDFSILPKALIVAGPRERFSEGDLARLEQFVLAGVPTAFFLDTKDINIEAGSFFASPLDTGLDSLLGRWGLGFKKGFVLDIQNQNIAIQQQAGPFVINNIVSYPPLPIITNLSRDNPITKDMDQLVLPFVSPISTASIKSAKCEILAETTKLSWFKTDLVTLSPYADFNPKPEDPRGPFTVAAYVEGSFEAAYPEPPKAISKSSAAISGMWLKRTSRISRVLLVGTSKFLDREVAGSPSNLVFFFNAIDTLSEDPDLVAVRSKGAKIRPFNVTLGDFSRQVVKFASAIFMPAGVAVYAFWRSTRRRRWKAGVRERLLS